MLTTLATQPSLVSYPLIFKLAQALTGCRLKEPTCQIYLFLSKR